MMQRLAAYANEHGRPDGAPYFSLDGKDPVTADEWSSLRDVWSHVHGITNVWSAPPLNGDERYKGNGVRSAPRVHRPGRNAAVHLNQKPLEFIRRIVAAATRPGDVVWEPFGGLCSGVVAATESGRDAYAVASSDPIDLIVTGDRGPAPALPGGRARTAVDLQREDIRFIRIAAPTFRARGGSLFRSAGFWAVAVLPLVALAGAVAVRRHRDRLAGDVAWARSRRASKVARRRLARAESLCSPDRHREFHAEVGRAMQGFLGDKLNVAEAGLIHDEIRAALAARGVDAALVDACLDCLERCDRERFAPAEPDPAAMQAMLAEAGRAMTELDAALTAS